MDLFDAASYFDRDPINDGYDGSYLFDGQVSSFDDSSSDGATNRRRVLSTGPSVTIPARRVIELYGDRWIVGTGTPDGFEGEVIRQHFNTKRATDLLALLTPGQALAAAAGTSVYAQKMYFKDVINALTDSEYDAQWNIFVAPGEAADKGSFFRDAAGRLYRVRNSYLPTEGLRVCQSDSLELDALQVCTFSTGAFDPVTETRSAGTTAVNGIKVEHERFYRFRHVSDAKLQAGDVMLFLPSTLALSQGLRFTMQAANWQVLAFQPELDAQVAHVRRA